MFTNALSLAIQLAAKAHQNQKDNSGLPYILHPLRVMEAVAHGGEPVMIVGVLHDVVEDTSVTLVEIEFSFGKSVADAVDAISRRTTETYREYIERVKKNPWATMVKVADIHDNMRPDRFVGRPKGIEKRYNKALEILGERYAVGNSVGVEQLGHQ